VFTAPEKQQLWLLIFFCLTVANSCDRLRQLSPVLGGFQVLARRLILPAGFGKSKRPVVQRQAWRAKEYCEKEN